MRTTQSPEHSPKRRSRVDVIVELIDATLADYDATAIMAAHVTAIETGDLLAA